MPKAATSADTLNSPSLSKCQFQKDLRLLTPEFSRHFMATPMEVTHLMVPALRELQIYLGGQVTLAKSLQKNTGHKPTGAADCDSRTL